MHDVTRIWSVLRKWQKKIYVDKSKEDQRRYNQQLNELNTKGFFTNEDGTNAFESE